MSIEHIFPAIPGPKGRPGKPEARARIDIHYSHHCFTEDLQKVGRYSREEMYEDLGRKEERAFCLERWELSKYLPEIVLSLADRRCYETRHLNFVTVELARAAPKYYVVYFRTKAALGLGVDLFIESAYPKVDNPLDLGGHKNATFNKILASALPKK